MPSKPTVTQDLSLFIKKLVYNVNKPRILYLLKGVPFLVYKFRSISDKRDGNGELLPDEVRLTSFSKLVRKLSLDELPQLVNVLGGEMSFVGPRPLLMEYLSLYNERQARRIHYTSDENRQPVGYCGGCCRI